MEESWRQLKRFKIGFVFFVILLAIITLVGFVYFKSNQPCANPALQCGGSCQPCQLLELKNPEILWAKGLQSDPGYIDLVSKIRNPNIDWGAKEIDYTFYAYDASGATTTLKSGQTFILPAEAKYIVEIRVPIKTMPTQIGIQTYIPAGSWAYYGKIDEPVTFANASFVPPQSTSSGPISLSASLPRITGLAKNASPLDLNNVTVIGLAIDSLGNPIAAGKTLINELAPFSQQNFDVFLPNIQLNPTSVELASQVYLYDIFKPKPLPASNQ